MGKKSNNYFELLSEQVSYCLKAARFLHETLEHFKEETLPERIEELHRVEHEADSKKHEMINKLAAEFITPIERDDILELAQNIDNVTDTIEDVLIRVYMFHISRLVPEAVRFSALIVQCCETLQKAMDELHRFQKSKELGGYLIKINQLEGEGDSLYTQAMRNLYASGEEPLYVMAWTETLNRFEKCCDACEDVSDSIESVIMGNS